MRNIIYPDHSNRAAHLLGFETEQEMRDFSRSDATEYIT
jgi:hypothetical protein